MSVQLKHSWTLPLQNTVAISAHDLLSFYSSVDMDYEVMTRIITAADRYLTQHPNVTSSVHDIGTQIAKKLRLLGQDSDADTLDAVCVGSAINVASTNAIIYRLGRRVAILRIAAIAATAITIMLGTYIVL